MGGRCAAVAWFDGVLAGSIVKGDDEAHVGGKAASYHAAVRFLHSLCFVFILTYRFPQ
jgi:hypothetical protein